MKFEEYPRFKSVEPHPKFAQVLDQPEYHVAEAEYILPPADYIPRPTDHTFSPNHLIALSMALYGDYPIFQGETSDKKLVKESRDSFFDLLVGGRFPTDGTYISSLQFIAIKFLKQGDKVICAMDGAVSKFDIFGDKFLRRFEWHVMKDPSKLWGRIQDRSRRKLNQSVLDELDVEENPLKTVSKIVKKVAEAKLKTVEEFKNFVLGPNPNRWRGTPEMIEENVKKLGMEDKYGYDRRGLHIKEPEKFFGVIPLQDILRAKEIGATKLVNHDVDEIFKLMSLKIAEVHRYANGGFGELLINDFGCVIENGKVVDIYFNIPDIVYDKKITPREQMATDYIDILFSSSMEMIRRGDNWQTIFKRLKYLTADASDEVRDLAKSKLKKQQMTLTDYRSEDPIWQSFVRGLLSQHNLARFFVLYPESAQYVRQVAIDALTI